MWSTEGGLLPYKGQSWRAPGRGHLRRNIVREESSRGGIHGTGRPKLGGWGALGFFPGVTVWGGQ